MSAAGATSRMPDRRTILITFADGMDIEIRLSSTRGTPVRDAGALSLEYVLPGDMAMDRETINRWNAIGRFTRAFIARGGDVRLVYDLWAHPGLLDEMPAHLFLFHTTVQAFVPSARPRPEKPGRRR